MYAGIDIWGIDSSALAPPSERYSFHLFMKYGGWQTLSFKPLRTVVLTNYKPEILVQLCPNKQSANSADVQIIHHILKIYSVLL
jgi:hypothetical protein